MTGSRSWRIISRKAINHWRKQIFHGCWRNWSSKSWHSTHLESFLLLPDQVDPYRCLSSRSLHAAPRNLALQWRSNERESDPEESQFSSSSFESIEHYSFEYVDLSIAINQFHDHAIVFNWCDGIHWPRAIITCFSSDQSIVPLFERQWPRYFIWWSKCIGIDVVNCNIDHCSWRISECRFDIDHRTATAFIEYRPSILSTESNVLHSSSRNNWSWIGLNRNT